MASKNKKELLQTPKGTRDILPHDLLYWRAVETKAEDIMRSYGFKPIRTPHIEKEEIFSATLGETSDIVEKQMYSFRTRGGDALVLRPEGTTSIMRAYFEHGMHTLPQPVMLYYKGSFFRHEKPQRGRLREFSQFGIEILGDEDAIADALTIRVIGLILSEIGIKSFIVNINSIGDKECAPLYRKDLVAFFKKKANNLCKDCKRRLKSNPLRILDCKEEKCVQAKQEAPQMFNYLCEECKKHLKNLLEYLDMLGIPYFLDNFLVRGFDYYSRTVFEFFEDNPDQNLPPKGGEQETSKNKEKEAILQKIAIAAGGRYDYLGDILGGRHIPAVGAAIGIERGLQIFKERKIKLKQDKTPKVFLIQLGDLAKRKSLILMEELRKAHISARHSLNKDSIRSQLKLADSLKVGLALIIGQKEALEEKAIIRDMETGGQEILHFSKIVDYIKEKI